MLIVSSIIGGAVVLCITGCCCLVRRLDRRLGEENQLTLVDLERQAVDLQGSTPQAGTIELSMRSQMSITLGDITPPAF